MYYQLGVLAAMSLVHGGGSFAILSSTVYNYICGMNPSDLIPNIDEVPDETRGILKQVTYRTFNIRVSIFLFFFLD